MTWTLSPSEINGYIVYRASDPFGPFLPDMTVVSGAAQVSDTDISSGQTYYYMVMAFDSNGEESQPSNIVSVTVPFS